MAERLTRWLIAAAILVYLMAAVLAVVWFVLAWPGPAEAPLAWLTFSAAYTGFLRLGYRTIMGLVTWSVRKWPPPTVFRA